MIVPLSGKIGCIVKFSQLVRVLDLAVGFANIFTGMLNVARHRRQMIQRKYKVD